MHTLVGAKLPLITGGQNTRKLLSTLVHVTPPTLVVIVTVTLPQIDISREACLLFVVEKLVPLENRIVQFVLTDPVVVSCRLS
jgi:hypothetical protein